MATDTHHPSRQYNAELEGLRSRVLQMGGMVELLSARMQYYPGVRVDGLPRGDGRLS